MSKYRNTKILFPYRDPRDALVSYVLWVDKLSSEQNSRAVEFGHKDWDKWTTEQKLHEVIEGSRQSTMLKNIAVLPELVKNFSGNPQVCVVRFEDFIGSNAGGDGQIQLKTMQQVAEFILGRELGEQQVKLVSEQSWGKDITFNNPQIGKWREFFTPSVSNSFKHSVWNDALIELGYETDDRW